MTIRDQRREAALDRIADHLQREGLEGATLRAMAAAAGTSDRMLLYYFADKDELLASALGRVAGRMAVLLDRAVPGEGALERQALLESVWSAAAESALAPFMRLWIEIAAAAARGREPYRAVAGAIADGFRAWLAQRLVAPNGVDPDAQAARLLATIEGLLLLDAVGRRSMADQAVAGEAASPLAG